MNLCGECVAARHVKLGEVMIFPPNCAAHAPDCRDAGEPPRKLRKAVVKVLLER